MTADSGPCLSPVSKSRPRVRKVKSAITMIYQDASCHSTPITIISAVPVPNMEILLALERS
ncbi:hypothetical protein D3C85_1795360 [compost metagenome]